MNRISEILGFHVKPMNFRHLWCTWLGTNKDLAAEEGHVAGHSQKTFQNVYNESTKCSAQKLIQAIEEKVGHMWEIEYEKSPDQDLNKAIQEKQEALRQHIRRERMKRIMYSKEEYPLNSKHPMANAPKVKFWVGAMALDPDWISSFQRCKREEFMRKTLFLCLQPGGEAATMRSSIVTFYKGDGSYSLQKAREGKEWDGLYQVLHIYKTKIETVNN